MTLVSLVLLSHPICVFKYNQCDEVPVLSERQAELRLEESIHLSVNLIGSRTQLTLASHHFEEPPLPRPVMIRSALTASFLLVAWSQLAMAGVINVEATRTTTETVFFPPRPTAAAVEHVYASVITSSPESTEYLLACEPIFTSPYPESCHDFAGVTLTHGASTMRVEIG